MIIELIRQSQTIIAKQPRKTSTASAKRVKHYDYVYKTVLEKDCTVTLDDFLTVLLYAQMQTNSTIWNVTISLDDDTQYITVAFSTFSAIFPELWDIDTETAEKETEGYEPPDIDDIEN